MWRIGRSAICAEAWRTARHCAVARGFVTHRKADFLPPDTLTLRAASFGTVIAHGAGNPRIAKRLTGLSQPHPPPPRSLSIQRRKAGANYLPLQQNQSHALYFQAI